MVDKRAIIRTQLESSAKTDLESICSKRGMTQIAVMTRLVSWFVRQEDTIQTAVMATLSDQAMASLARQILKRLASGDNRSE